MKKIYLTLIALVVVLGIIGYFLGWLDNGLRQTNYDANTLPSRLDQ